MAEDNNIRQKIRFGMGTTIATKNNRVGRKNFFNLSFRDRLIIPKSEDMRLGIPIMLVAGEYMSDMGADGVYIPDPKKRPIVEFDSYAVHTVKQSGKIFRTYMCMAGFDKEHEKDCVGCELIRQGHNYIKTTLYRYITAIVVAWHHTVPATAKDGSVVINKKTGTPYMAEELCTGAERCKHCRKGVARHFGRKVYLELGTTHMDHLAAISGIVNAQCGNCGGELYPIRYVCPNCGEVIVDLNNTSQSEDEIRHIVGLSGHCPRCNAYDLPEAIYACEAECGKPTFISLWDEEVLWLSRKVSSKSSSLDMLKHAYLEDFVEDPKLVEAIRELAVPYDFKTALYFPSDTDAQAKQYMVQNPYKDGTAVNPSVPYGTK